MILIISDKMGNKLTLNLDSYGEQTVTSDDHHDELKLHVSFDKRLNGKSHLILLKRIAKSIFYSVGKTP